MNDDNDFFLNQMKGVTPLKKNNKLPTNKSSIKFKTITKKSKDIKKVNLEISPKSNIKKSHFALEKINIKKNIKKNILKIDKTIDFHGKSLLEAEEIFSSTIIECFIKQKRCLLFVTGKGLFKSKDSEENNKPRLYHGVIRASFIEWVKLKKFSKYILSYEQALIDHGSDGAFYVYLRKKQN